MQQTARKQLYDLIISGLPVALFVVNNAFRIVEFNQAAEELTGWPKAEVLGRTCSDVLGSSLCGEHCPLRESLRTGKTCMGREALIMGRNQEQIPIFFSSAALTDEEGNLINGVEVFRDASAEKKLEAQKKNIISLLTHDLKAPVAIAGGFVERLLKGKAGPLTDKQRSYLETVSREVGRLERYILSFLEISKLEAGQIELHLESLDLGNLLTDIIEGFRLQAGKKDITLHLDLPAELPPLHGDGLQITRVMTNLLDNAIKYSEPGKSVHVKVTVDGDQLVVEVRDEGIGIAPEQQDHIFESFYQVPREAQKARGTGLGLAAVKAIVEAHGGTTRVSSEPGRGSSFFISFPL
ncbi:MAG TPA: PAS domain-containing sensor histidine kinase [Desulfobulbus sp.]|nr:PAS domain-containing sensor histidine kinase [Desulfobulbus sp.]